MIQNSDLYLTKMIVTRKQRKQNRMILVIIIIIVENNSIPVPKLPSNEELLKSLIDIPLYHTSQGYI